MNNLVDRLRADYVGQELKRLGESWPERSEVLNRTLSAKPTVLELQALGDILAKAFQLPSLRGNRGQKSLSSGGRAWQVIVGWYLNLCYAGTDAIVLSGNFVPPAIKQALRVTYRGNTATRLSGDIDLVVIRVPGVLDLEAPPSTSQRKAQFSRFVDQNYAETSIVLIQTKTNWNDCAQVPMLWNWIYDFAYQAEAPPNGYVIGEGRFPLKDLKSFAYAFVTVPSQRNLDSFKPTSMPVARVASMSGGHYWGHPDKNGVANSLRQFFNLNYSKSNYSLPSPRQIGEAAAGKHSADWLRIFRLRDGSSDLETKSI